MAGIETDAFEKVAVAGVDDLWRWLAEHHEREQSVWLVTWKKGDDRHVSRDAVLDALVAHGWIDGIRRKLDDERTMQLVGRRRRQAWARSYKERAERLLAENRMHFAGLASLEEGRRSGRWNESDPVDDLVVPDDLRSALDAVDDTFFDAAAPSYRRNVLRWIAGAKREPTRAKRIAATVEASRAGRKMRNM